MGWTMVHLAWFGGVIGLCGAAVRAALRSARPETRYGAALTCLIAFAAAPGFIFVQFLELDQSSKAARLGSEPP